MDLKDEALELIRKRMHNPEYIPDNWDKVTVEDKRDFGYYCSDCRTFMQKPMMVMSDQHEVIFVSNVPLLVWIVKYHYDGCCGWD